MAKIKKKSNPLKINFNPRWAHLLWGALAVCVWTGEQFWKARGGSPFSFLVFIKGFFLLALAAAVYRASVIRGFSLLGMFPLLWLAVSKFQWGLCSDPDYHYWLWLVLFLLCEILIFTFSDGKKLFMLLSPLWAALSWLFPFSYPLSFTFLTASRERFKSSEWTRWGGLGIGLGIFVISRGWRVFNLNQGQFFDMPVRTWVYFLISWFFLVAVPLVLWKKSRTPFVKTPFFRIFFFIFLLGPWVIALAGGMFSYFYLGDLFDLLIDKRYIAFFLLGWLGLIAFPPKGTFRFAVIPMFLLTFGFLFWAGVPPRPGEMAILRWVLVFFAGFGFESLRKDLMDPTWHGRLVWLALGMAFFAGVV